MCQMPPKDRDYYKILGVSRQTVLQRVKRGELQSLHVRRGRRRGLLIKVPEDQRDLFERTSTARG